MGPNAAIAAMFNAGIAPAIRQYETIRSKTKLLVMSPPNHYVLRGLDALRDVIDISVSDDHAEQDWRPRPR